MKHSKLGKEIVEGLNEIITLEKGRKAARLNKDAVSILPMDEFNTDDIKKMRHKFEMSLSVFARVLGVSPKTVEAWESGFRKPTGAHARLLQIIAHDPKTLKYLVSKK